MTLERELDAAGVIAVEAGDIALRYFRGDVGAEAKGDRDVVTAADRASEEHIAGRLADLFPCDGIVGEEGAALRESSDRIWYVDPVDGTLNFSRGIPVWCVSVALVERGSPVVGAIYDPVRRELYSGATGMGVTRDGHPIVTSECRAARDALVHVTVDFAEASLNEGLHDLERLAPQVLRTRNLGSAALALAYVASGQLDAMVHRRAHPWDYAAGVALIREAGGTVTDIAGRVYRPQSETLLAAASPSLHAQLLALLTTAGEVNVQ